MNAKFHKHSRSNSTNIALMPRTIHTIMKLSLKILFSGVEKLYWILNKQGCQHLFICSLCMTEETKDIKPVELCNTACCRIWRHAAWVLGSHSNISSMIRCLSDTSLADSLPTVSPETWLMWLKPTDGPRFWPDQEKALTLAALK